MAEVKAKYVCSDSKNAVKTFEYRGRWYDVNYSIWLCDYEQPFLQHKHAQERIDREIAQLKRNNAKAGNGVEEALEEFWKFVEA